jgi:spore coat polysaccharide biosynthesis protein SpsF
VNNIITLPKKKVQKPKVGVIIQARMTSHRFPGKSLALIHGKPVIQWCMERAKKIRISQKEEDKPTVVLAVPDTPESEPMLELADTLKVENFCGSELNVLSRYYNAACFFGFNYIIRLTGDCPFIDPRICSEVIQLLIWRKLDYCSNCFPEKTYPKGLDCEAFTFDALEAAYLCAETYDLEHVTPWLQRTEGIKRGQIKQKIDFSHKNWCVDEPEDIERLEKEIKRNSPIIIGSNKNDN